MNAARGSRIGVAAVVWLVQLLLSVIYLAHMLLSQLSVASCTADSCDYERFSNIIQTFNVGLGVALLVSAAGMIATRNRGWRAIVAPILGIVTATVLLLVAYPLSRAALELPLFGNRV